MKKIKCLYIKQTVLLAMVFLLCSPNIIGQSLETKLIISPLVGDFYVFTTYNTYKGMRIPANGLYLVTNNGVVMIDTPWDTTQYAPLLDSIRAKHHQNVTMAIATHFHEDRTGGFEFYKLQGIKTYTTKLTDEFSEKRGMSRAEFLITKDTLFSIGQYSFHTFYPGQGHTPDNIVIWFEKEKILYGGCLIKSVSDDNLGNLADANTKAYPTTVRNVIQHCKYPRFVIPGHQDWLNVTSFDHTLKMALKEARKNNK